jgi:hypothetical protein
MFLYQDYTFEMSFENNGSDFPLGHSECKVGLLKTEK